MKKRMRFPVFLLALVMLLTTMPMGAYAAELPFTDVPQNAWYRKAVEYAYENGLFSGTGETTFSPEAPMTRAMFVQVLANKADNFNKDDWAGKSSFSDVNAKKWYAPAVEWAAKAGLVSGVGDGKFAPEKNVSREQMAAILYNYAKKTGNDTTFDEDVLDSFPDGGTVSNFAREAMKWAVTHKVINGSGGKLVPNNNAERCEVAQVAVNADPVLVYNNVEVSPVGPDDPSFEKLTRITSYNDFCKMWRVVRDSHSPEGASHKERTVRLIQLANYSDNEVYKLLETADNSEIEQYALRIFEALFEKDTYGYLAIKIGNSDLKSDPIIIISYWPNFGEPRIDTYWP